MIVDLSIETQGIQAAAERYRRAPRVVDDYIQKNLRGLGKVLVAKMRHELKPVKYTGSTERSVSIEYTANAPYYTLEVGPTSPNAKFVRTGSKPHYAPIGPLKRWAAWKLGDANAAYAIQKSIAKFGTSQHLKRKGLGEAISGHGIGLNYPARTLARNDVKLAIDRTTKRIPLDIARALGGGT